MAGLDADGFTTKTFEDIREDIRGDIDVEFGASNASRLDVSVLGILVAIVATLAAALWQLALLVYNSQSPSGAFGVLLDRVLELTGLERLGQAKSTVGAVAIGTNATLLTAGRRIRNANTLTYWTSTADATIATLASWTISTAYAVGALVSHDTGKIYSCTGAGTSAGAGGPTGTSTTIVDGSCTWRYVGAGTAAVAVAFESEEFGQIVGAAGDLTTIETAQGGWSSVVNPLDAEQGREIESDAQARIRRNALLRSTGNAALDAILSDVAKVSGVLRVLCFKNDSDVTDVNGVPPHSVEVLVRGGADQDIIDALFGTVAAGIRTYGGVTGSLVDSQGVTESVSFSRPTVVNTYLEVDVVIVADEFPSDGDAQIKQALVDFSEGLAVGGVQFSYGLLDIGDAVEPDQLRTPVKQVSGVPIVSALRLGTAPSPVGTTTLTMTARQLADLDTSRILVTHV